LVGGPEIDAGGLRPVAQGRIVEEDALSHGSFAFAATKTSRAARNQRLLDRAAPCALRTASLPPPGRDAAGLVLEKDALGLERRADAVGLGEVLRAPRLVALPDERLDPRRVGIAAAAQPLLGVLLQKAEERAGAEEPRLRLGAAVAVERRGELVHVGERQGRVEIVL